MYQVMQHANMRLGVVSTPRVGDAKSSEIIQIDYWDNLGTQ